MSEIGSIYTDDCWTKLAGGKMLVYAGEDLTGNLDREAISKFVRQKRAIGAMWSYNFNYDEESPWYRHVCTTVDYDLDKLKSRNSRHNIRRGLQRCIVKKVDYDWLADNFYEVYFNACSRYKNHKISERSGITEQIREFSNDPNREAFGVFANEKLIAYATIYIRKKTVHVYSGKFDPAYANTYPMWALLFTIGKHYLKENGYKKIDGGFRALLHETDIGSFLVRLGWEKEYCRLEVYTVLRARILLFCARFFRPILRFVIPSRHHAYLESVFQAQDIAKATKISDIV